MNTLPLPRLQSSLSADESDPISEQDRKLLERYKVKLRDSVAKGGDIPTVLRPDRAQRMIEQAQLEILTIVEAIRALRKGRR